MPLFTTSTGALYTVNGTLTGPTPVAVDLPVVSSSAADATVVEGGTAQVRISRSVASAVPLTFTYATANGSGIAGTDYTATSGTGTILANALFVDLPVVTQLRAGYQGTRSLTLTISNAMQSGASLTVSDPEARVIITDTETPVGNHAAYEIMVGSPYLLKAYSLRNAAQVDALLSNQSNKVSTSYNPGADTHPNAQDAAKMVIAAFDWPNKPQITIAAAGADAVVTAIPLVSVSTITHSTQYKFGNNRPETPTEVVTTGPSSAYRDTTAVTMLVPARGAYGTTPAALTGGTQGWKATNSVYNQIKVGLARPAGNTFFLRWDVRFTQEWLKCGIGTYKAFQIEGDNNIYIEPQMRFGGNPGGGVSVPSEYDPEIHIGVATVRSYGQPVAPTTDNNPVLPMAEVFIVWPERWTRWFVRVQLQVAPAPAVIDVWLADEVQEPVQILVGATVNTRAEMSDWRVEMNTSSNALPNGRCVVQTAQSGALTLPAFRDLTVYIRDFVCLENAPTIDITPHIVKPT